MTDAAPWLKTMENGGLGEARAKAFLMDRFWVLERSVDVEGADYLIQRRLTNQNFLDRDPPRLGIVQVKFIQDGNTSISIKKSYVCNDRDTPYSEFFLLVFTGREDHEKSYLLSSNEILKEFGEHGAGDDTVLRVKGSKLLATSNYEVLQKKRALDRIEHALANADFMSNRRFLSGSSYYIDISPDHIDSDLLAPLDNTHGDIPETFFKEKKKLQSTLFDIAEVVEAMQQMLRATDPEEALRLYDDVIAQYIGSGFGPQVSFSCDWFNDEDFLESVRSHKARLAKLRELGVEGSYFKLQETFENILLEKLANPKLYAWTEAIRVEVTYDFTTLRNVAIEIAAGNGDRERARVVSSCKGKQVIHYDLKDLLPKPSSATADSIGVRSQQLRERIWLFRRPFQAALDALLLGDDLVAF